MNDTMTSTAQWNNIQAMFSPVTYMVIFQCCVIAVRTLQCCDFGQFACLDGIQYRLIRTINVGMRPLSLDGVSKSVRFTGGSLFPSSCVFTSYFFAMKRSSVRLLSRAYAFLAFRLIMQSCFMKSELRNVFELIAHSACLCYHNFSHVRSFAMNWLESVADYTSAADSSYSINLSGEVNV